MLNKLKNIPFSPLLFFTFICLFLVQCRPPIYQKTAQTSLSLDTTYANLEQANAIILPYKQKLEAEMNEVLVVSAVEFTREKGKSQTILGNLVADLSLEISQQNFPTNIDFCLLNFGGLRTSLPKGEITKGKVFELMPFENELVVVTISKEQFDTLVDYVKNVGGQPVAGIKMNFSTTPNQIKIKNRKNDKSLNTIYKVVTSDYLANGGDNMNFFLNPINYEKVGIKLRDAIIQYCKEQNKQGKQLNKTIDDRIVLM